MMLFPQVVQISRMALALQSLKRSAFENMLAYALPLTEMGIPVMDNIDTDRAIRDLARGDGLPTSYLKDSEAVEATRAARAQAQQAAAQQEMAMQAMKSKPLVEAGMEAMGTTGAPV
jgi:carbamoylphosphate synthase small subunit